MTESTSPDAPLDPKERMRQALEAKKAAQKGSHDGTAAQKSLGSTHSAAAGKRQFRRKSGG